MRPSQNLPLPPRIYPLFQLLYATLPESTPLSQNIPPFSTTMWDPPRIYPSLPGSISPFSRTISDPHRIYPSLTEYTPPFKTICDPPRIYPSLPEYTSLFNNYKIMRSSQNLPFPPRIFFNSGSEGSILSQLHVVSRKRDVFSDWGVDSWNIAYSCRKARRDISWEGRGGGGRKGEYIQFICATFWECRIYLLKGVIFREGGIYSGSVA